MRSCCLRTGSALWWRWAPAISYPFPDGTCWGRTELLWLRIGISAAGSSGPPVWMRRMWLPWLPLQGSPRPWRPEGRTASIRRSFPRWRATCGNSIWMWWRFWRAGRKAGSACRKWCVSWGWWKPLKSLPPRERLLIGGSEGEKYRFCSGRNRCRCFLWV